MSSTGRAWQLTSIALQSSRRRRGGASTTYRDFVDSRFAANVVGASEAGLRVGVYHFLTAQTDDEARAEARFFCAAIEPYRERITLWAAVDVESRHLPADKVKLTGIVKAFCAEVAAHGFAPMVYTNPNWLKTDLTTSRSTRSGWRSGARWTIRRPATPGRCGSIPAAAGYRASPVMST